MAYNINKLTSVLAQLNGEKRPATKKGPAYKQWKPKLTDDGKARTYNVRLLPYQDQNEQPVQEVAFYDDKKFSKWRLVAPAQFGLEDPVAELVTELRKDRSNKNAWSVIKPLLPHSRFFAPLVVREEMSEGVQVWELSPTLCSSLYSILVSEDFRDEDIQDPDKGYDFQVTVTPTSKVFKADNGTEYPVNDVKIQPRTRPTPLAKTEAEKSKILGSIPNLLDIFTKQCKTPEQLREVLEEYLAVDSAATATADDEKSDGGEETSAASVEEQFAGL